MRGILPFRLIFSGLMVAALLSTSSRLNAQTPPAQSPPAPPASQNPPTPPARTPTPVIPIDFDKVQREAQQEPTLKIDDSQFRYYTRIVGHMPTFLDIVGRDTDLKNGPTPYGGMTYNEFVKMVTPQALHSSGSGITPRDTAQLALTNWAGQFVLRKLWQELRDARTEDEVRSVRARIDRELAALKGGG